MIALKKLFFIVFLILVIGCAQSKDFGYGIKQMNIVDAKYNTTMDTYPKNPSTIDMLIKDLKELIKLQLDKGQESLYHSVGIRILNLESEKLFIEGQKYGSSGTATDGFGCKQRPLIIESVGLRNQSASKGFEAVNTMREFIVKYPTDAESVNITEKNALFFNATFYKISSDARKDSSIINSFCPINRTLELYREEFKKKTNYTEDFINGLDYEQAVPIWKELRGWN